MLYNVFINHGIAVKVTEFNQYCTACNEAGSIETSEKRVMNIELPSTWKNTNPCDKFEAVKKYINLNNLL